MKTFLDILKLGAKNTQKINYLHNVAIKLNIVDKVVEQIQASNPLVFDGDYEDLGLYYISTYIQIIYFHLLNLVNLKYHNSQRFEETIIDMKLSLWYAKELRYKFNSYLDTINILKFTEEELVIKLKTELS